MNISLPNNWTPRAYQIPLWEYLAGGGKRAVTNWHRRSGKDELFLNHTACSAFERVGNYWYMLPEYSQARKSMWDAINPRTGNRRIDDIFPMEIRETTKEAEMMIRFKSKSTFQLVGSDNYNSLVGSPPVGLVFSEYALSDPSAWGYLMPIVEENGGWAAFNSTPRGKNHFKGMCELAQSEQGWFYSLCTAENTGVYNEKQLQTILKQMQKNFGDQYGKSLWLQEYFCFPPGTQIWTNKGQVSIEQIKINDVVLTHAGRWRKVTSLFQHEKQEDLIKIKSSGSCKPLICTKNHPVRICDTKKQTYKWIPAGDIKNGDYVVFPRLKLNENVMIDSELAELMAWFISEGSVARNFVQFSLNKKEIEFSERIKYLGSKYGKTSIRQAETCQVIIINSCLLADFMTSHCGSGASNKRIPWDLIAGHEEIVYKTLIDGDGCRGDYNGPNEIYTTISYSLALDVQMLAHLLGKRASVNLRPAEKQSQTIEGRMVNVSDSYNIRISIPRETINGRPQILPQKHGVASLVKDVELIPFEGTVYNFSVQYDESYVAEGRVVHNCAFDAAQPGAIWGEALDKVRVEGRICLVPHIEGHEVFTGWDLGYDDDTVIWFYQIVDGDIRFIDYHENRFKDVAFYGGILKEKHDQFGYEYGIQWLPHDARPRTVAAGGKSILQQFLDINKHLHGLLGSFRIAPRLDVEEGIQAARATFPLCWFDETLCVQGMEHLISYKRSWDDEKKVFSTAPVHDGASHAADALRTVAVTWRHNKPVVKEMDWDEKMLAANPIGQTFGVIKDEFLRKQRNLREMNL
jgi:hypothetical protein